MRNEENARGHHRRRVQVRRDWGGRRHRPRQPEVQGHLGALGEACDCDEPAGGVQQRPGPDLDRQLRDGERPVGGVEQERPDQEQHRRHPGDEQGHQGRGPGVRVVPVEADQVIGGDGRQVPEDEDQDEVLRHRESHHGAHEQEDKEVETDTFGGWPAPVFEVQRQVPRGVHEDGETYAGRQQRVERREPVELQVQPQVPARRPRHVHRAAAGEPAPQRRPEGEGRERRPDPGGPGGYPRTGERSGRRGQQGQRQRQ